MEKREKNGCEGFDFFLTSHTRVKILPTAHSIGSALAVRLPCGELLVDWWRCLVHRGERGAGLLVCGQKVLADVALSKDDARALAVNKGTLGKAGADRRNLYLVCPPYFFREATYFTWTL